MRFQTKAQPELRKEVEAYESRTESK